jgi:hypothetical protein
MFLTIPLQYRVTRAKEPLRGLTIPSPASSSKEAIMTSISALSSSNSYQSPLQLLQSELQSEVNSGAISRWSASGPAAIG